MNARVCGLVLMISFCWSNRGTGAEEWDLKTCEKMALKFSPIVGNARAVWLESKAAKRTDFAEQLPHIGVKADLDRQDFADGKNEEAIRVYLEASQELLRYGNRTDARYAAIRAERARYAQYQQTLVNEASRVRKAYFRYLMTKDEIRSRYQLVAYFRAKEKRLKIRLEKGLARPIELQEAELEVLEQKLRITNLERALRAQRLDLFSAIGAVDKLPVREVDIIGPSYEDLELLDPAESELDDLVLEAFTNSPLLRDIQKQLSEQADEITATRWKWAPDIDLDVSKNSGRSNVGLSWTRRDETWHLIGTGRRLLKTHNQSHYVNTPLFPGNDDEFRLGARISFNLFEGGRRISQRTEEVVRRQQLMESKRQEQNRLELQLVEAFYTMKSLKENTQILRRRADVARMRLDTIEELFENAMGNLNFDDILRQRSSVNDAEQGYFAERLQYVLATVELRRLLGKSLEEMRDREIDQ